MDGATKRYLTLIEPVRPALKVHVSAPSFLNSVHPYLLPPMLVLTLLPLLSMAHTRHFYLLKIRQEVSLYRRNHVSTRKTKCILYNMSSYELN